MAKRKERIDGKAVAVKIMAAAGKEIHAPSHVLLTDTDKPFFANVIEEFARSDWTAHQLEIAAMTRGEAVCAFELACNLRAKHMRNR